MFLQSILIFIPTLLLLTFITYVYAIVVWFIFNHLRYVWWYLTVYPRMSYEEKRQTPGTYKKMVFGNPLLFKKSEPTTKYFKLLVIVYFVANIILFANMYRHYETKNPEAQKSRPYLINASVANFYSVLFAKVAAPYALQVQYGYRYVDAIKRFLFDKAEKTLPMGNAEEAFWKAKLFFYPYALHHYRYLSKIPFSLTNDFQGMRRYKHEEAGKGLNEIWQLMETMQTKKMRDEALEVEMVSLSPLYLDYYFSNKLFVVPYDTTLIPGNKTTLYLTTNPEMVRRIALIQKETDTLKNLFLHNPRFMPIIEKNPRVLILTEWIALMNMSNLIIQKINQQTFSCQDPLLREYQQRREDFMEASGDLKAAYEKLYNGSIEDMKFILEMKSGLKDSSQGEFGRRVLDKYCQISVRGVSKDYVPNPKYSNSFNNMLYDKGVFAREVKILEEMFR